MSSTLHVHTTWGTVEVAAEEGAVISCSLSPLSKIPLPSFAVRDSKIDAASALDKKVLKEAQTFVTGLFKNKKEKMPALRLPEASPFIRRCWKELKRVPHGKTVSYQQLAKKAGSPRAARAAGSACASNEIPLFIPCHRVLASDGKLGGFSSGLPWKMLLLKCEGGRHEK